MGVSKFVYGGETKFDITDSTVTAEGLASGLKAYGADGEAIIGTNTYDANTSDGTAVAAEILDTKSAYVNGSKVVGVMPNRGGVTGTITDASTPYAIQNGYHDGSGRVSVSSNTLLASNIKDGVNILGVVGEYTGEGVTAQSKNVTPATVSQTVLPDQDYDYLSQVVVAAIPYTETQNPQGGITVQIG